MKKSYEVVLDIMAHDNSLGWYYYTQYVITVKNVAEKKQAIAEAEKWFERDYFDKYLGYNPYKSEVFSCVEE